jgi:cellulose synthase/poly-beta-1,6-N-acetylglucosamine synthase-like glycosyltransferase
MEIVSLGITILLTSILIYPLFSWGLSRFFPKEAKSFNTQQHFFSCIIPVYNNLALAEKCIQSLLAQTYARFRIYVVVDGNRPEIFKSSNDKVVYLYPDVRLGSKHRSLHHALLHLQEKPDYVMIFDADNLAEKHYLETINREATPEYKSIQGRRIAKNLDSIYACLDAANEYFYNVFFRQVPSRLQSSALTSGSGVAVEYNLFKKFFDFRPVKEQMTGVIHGEDKFLQVFIVQEGFKIKYTNECTVFDEKVAKGSDVSSQRSRWFISYFKCLPYNIRMIFEGVKQLNWRKFIFGLQASYPPIFMLLGTSILTAVTLLFVHVVAGVVLFIGILCLLVSFPLFLITSKAPKKVVLSLLSAPRFIFYQVIGFLKIRNAYNKTLVTQNSRDVALEELVDAKPN